MRRAPALLLAVLTAVTVLPSGPRPAEASCAGPYLTRAEDLVLHRGTSVEIDGVGFANGCQDTGACSSAPGCSSCDYGPAPTPMSDITLTLRQHGRSWPLGTADARVTRSVSGAVSWSVEVPVDVRTGRARLVPEHGQPVEVRVR